MKTKFSKKVLSVFLCITLIMTYLPISAMAASASSDHISRVADPSTMDTWEDFFLPGGKISTENAGGVWMDKSVFTNNSDFSHNGITMNDRDAFLVALSAMATNMTVTGMSHVPTDTMLILDVSASMGPGQNNVASELIKAANESIASLLDTNSHSRVGVVLYSGPTTQGGSATANDAVLVLPLGRYETRNDTYLNLSNNRVSLNNNVVIEGTNNRPTTSNKSVTGGTYIQKGVMLAAAELTADGLDTTINDSLLGTIKRKPVMVLMSDGSPTFSSTNFQNPTSINLGDGTATSASQGFVNQLTAAYAKSLVEEKYGTEPLFYTIGLGVSNDAVALSVLDPDNRRASVAVNDFWTQWNNATVGNTVTVQSGTLWSGPKTVTKIAGLEQNYVDEFINVTNNGSGQGSLGDRLIQAFADIVSKINLQSQYKPTLISQSGENHSGFISFVDKVGEYMQVTDVKGILINDTLYSGADLASNFVAGGGKLGTFDNPTNLGHEMVAAVRERIGLANDDEARTLIGLAYEYGQIRFNNVNDYSNYIGWYADANSKFLGFYQDGVTNITDPDAVYTIKSYGYLGVEHDSNMMYSTVQVRHNIKTGEETVAFAVPAALIPVMTYNVSLDENGDLLDIEISGSDSPIRLVYEVALDSHINEWNVKEVVSADYLADVHNVNADGSINFYTNDWEHTNSTGYNTVNTYSYFNPSRQNDKYYFTSDAPIYADDNGTLYAGSAAPDTKGTFYNAFTVYEKDGSALSKKTIYRQLSEKALETAEPTDGTNNYHIPSGDVHVNLEGYTIQKAPNETNTLNVANEPFVDIYGHNVNDVNHSFYVGATLGNNGRLTLTPQTGIKLSKKMADGVAAPNTPFIFDIYNTTDVGDGRIYPALLVKADGKEQNINVNFDSGNTTVELKVDEVLYIGGLTNNQTFRIVERESAEYVATATGLSNDGKVTVIQNAVMPVSFVNDAKGTGNLTVAKEVEHDFGVDYQIPNDKLFTMQVTLSGIGTANETFDAKHTNGTYTKIQTDDYGKFIVQLAHEQQFEVFGLPTGTVAKVEEIVGGTGFTPAYYDNGTLGDGEVTVVKDSTVSVIVVNDYQAAEVYPVNITVTGNKQLVGAAWSAEHNFNFRLEKLLPDGSWKKLGEEATAKEGSASFDFNNAFVEERYTAQGVYYYRIIEIQPTTPLGGISYDKTVHSFAVHVSDKNMDGQLEITEVVSARPNTTVITQTNNGWNVNANFTNTYSVRGYATVTIDVNKSIDNIGGADKSLSGYKFGLFNAQGQQVSTLTTTERGFARFVLTYDAEEMNTSEEEFHYILKEIAPNPMPKGWNYSTKEVSVTVKVKDNGNGTISAVIYEGVAEPTNAGTAISTAFTNVYNPADAELEIDFVKKELSGRDMNSNDNFTFEVQLQDGTPVLYGSNNGTETVTFNDTLKFDKVGTHFYNIVETSTNGKGVTVDKTTYSVIVNVTDTNGQLTANYVLVNAVGEEVVFRNTYRAADTTYSISGTKELSGRTLLNDEFTFVLAEALNVNGDVADDTRIYETHNEFGGKFTFPEITYTKAGTYYYVVTEKQNSGSSYGIKYDTNKYVVTVTVIDDTENGKLVASANLDADDIVFNNKYVAESTSKHIDGEKVLTGKTLVDGEFEFELWQSNENWEYVGTQYIQTVSNDQTGNIPFTFVDYTNNNATNFTKAGTYYYLIKEVNCGQTVDRVTYDNVVYRVRVDITDDLLGQLHATAHIYDDAGVPQQSIIFNNIFTPKPEDITVEIGIEKTVVNKGSEKMGPDGFEFLLENVDTKDKISVKTDTDGKAIFSIKYTEADIGKTYTYKLTEVNGGKENISYSTAEYAITVAISLNENNELVATLTKNGEKEAAVVAKFENVYDYTPIPESEYPSGPVTGDFTNIHIWFALLFVSGGGFFGTTLFGRKRKEEN